MTMDDNGKEREAVDIYSWRETHARGSKKSAINRVTSLRIGSDCQQDKGVRVYKEGNRQFVFNFGRERGVR